MRNFAMIGAAALLGFGATATQASVLIDFESTASGALAEGSAIGGITFSSALGSGLEIGNYSPQSQGQGLLARNDSNGNFILGAIAGGTDYISIDFGNDDPFFVIAGDLAVLKVYSGATLLSTVSIALTPDDILNQTISYSGVFDNFSFAYTNAAGDPFTGGPGTQVGLIEVIDNIVYGSTSAVPEPSTWALMIVGFGLVGATMRRRRAHVVFA